jgi:hypothetical protein
MWVSKSIMSCAELLLTSCVWVALDPACASGLGFAELLVVHAGARKPSGPEHQTDSETKVSAVAARPLGIRWGLEYSMSARTSARRICSSDLGRLEQARVPDERREPRLDVLGSTFRTR